MSVTEMWKEIPGYKGVYEVSNLGNVRSRRRGCKVIRQEPNNNGYMRVELTDAESKKSRHFVHRLVAAAFVPCPDGCNVVNHLDFDHANNRADNLEWVTQKRNMEYSAERGRFDKTPEHKAKLRESAKSDPVIGIHVCTGHMVIFDSIKATSEAGFNPANVWASCQGRVCTHRGFRWEYANVNKRTKALAIPKAVKDRVWQRDNHCCVYCGNPQSAPNAHFISRAQGGLGIEQNILTLCADCHRRYDQSTDRKKMRAFFEGYLRGKYPDWDEKKLTYRRD